MKIRFGFLGFLVALTAVASLAQDINYEAGVTMNVSDGALAPYGIEPLRHAHSRQIGIG